MAEYSVIGKRLPRVGAIEKVTGRAKYAADFDLPGMLWGKVKRSPYAHAKILDIDTSKAERLPGVKAICTGKDFGGFKWGWAKATRDEEPLAVTKVRYIGEGVAGVAAIDEEVAAEACELIEVAYEELPAVWDPFEALKDGAPQIHDEMPDVKNNISCEFHMDFGDVEKAFSESYLVREDNFRTPRISKGYVEPSAILAHWDAPDHVTVRASKGSPYFIWRHISACFHLPMNKVRVIQPFIGCDFGGTKNDSVNGDWCALMLSKMSGKPVKIVYTMDEEIATCLRRHTMFIYIKTGVDRDGMLQATQIKIVADSGAYTRISPLTVYLTGICMTIPYKLPNFKTDVYCPYTNTPMAGAMRGHGVAHTRFAADVQLDMFAEELGIDPLEIRLRNAIAPPKPGDPYVTINDLHVHSFGVKEGLEKVAERVNWKERKKAAKAAGSVARGMGIAAEGYLSGTKLSGHNACAAVIRICEDGSINLLTGATDVGQGSDTVVCQIAAEELGVNYEDIGLRRVDSDVTPVDPGSYGSRVTVLAGEATQKAAADAKRQLLEIAGQVFAVSPEDVDIKQRRVFVKSDPTKSMDFSRLVRIACYTTPGMVIMGAGYSTRGVDMPDLATGRGDIGTDYSSTAQVAEVEADLETGLVKCLDLISAEDCGRPLNPMSVEIQSQGGAVQGLGQALYEDLIMDKCLTLNPTFLDYKRPRAPEVPFPSETIHIITDSPHGPFGAKEASEGSISCMPATVINALHDATGVWITELPAKPEKVFWALKERRKVVSPELDWGIVDELVKRRASEKG